MSLRRILGGIIESGLRDRINQFLLERVPGPNRTPLPTVKERIVVPQGDRQTLPTEKATILRDYQHAARVFTDNNFKNAPKVKFLYHTYFDINPEAFVGFNRRGVGPINASTNFGVLVKSVKLPTYTVETSTLHQYNRKRVVQTRLRYDPVDIIFHDDGGDKINQLWEAYYTYYYYDAMNPDVRFGDASSGQGSGADYNIRNIYDDSIAGNSKWGYSGDSTSGSQIKVPFFKNITIFGFNQRNFTAYTLVNPIITNFTHDTYSYAEGGGVMENRMTLTYETALYNYGELESAPDLGELPDFADGANS